MDVRIVVVVVGVAGVDVGLTGLYRITIVSLYHLIQSLKQHNSTYGETKPLEIFLREHINGVRDASAQEGLYECIVVRNLGSIRGLCTENRRYLPETYLQTHT